MFTQKLKTKIGFYIALLLLFCMVLINFIMIETIRKMLIKNEVDKVDLFLSDVENQIRKLYLEENILMNMEIKEKIDDKYHDIRILCLIVSDKERKIIYSNGIRCELKEDIEEIVKHTILTQKRVIQLKGNNWGNFWKQKHYLVAAIPLYQNDNIIGGIGIVINLKNIYYMIRKTQQVTWFYILVNLLIFSIIGIYRFSKLIINPIHRLIDRLEEYNEKKNEILLVRENDRNEFNQLSKALNSIVNRVSEDKEKLKTMIASLSKVNADLKKAQNDLIRAEKISLVGRLSSGLAHEIGNPVGIISGYFELIKKGNTSDEERNEYIVRSEKELNRIHTIIRQLLNFTRNDNEYLINLSVDKIIEEIKDDIKLQHLISKTDLYLDLKAQEIKVLANPDKLRQVFLNLIINASDAILASKNRLNGKIVFKTDILKDEDENCLTKTSFLRIMCIDNGTGIEKECIKNIFEPFFTTKEPGKGSGLGLWVSSMIIEAMGGTIKAKSVANNGTSIIIKLPLYKNERKPLFDLSVG